MPGSGNFTSVTLGEERSADFLKVNGATTGDVDRVTTILVVIAPEDVAQKLLSATEPQTPPSASVALPAGQTGWTVTFSGEQAPFQAGDTLLLTGVMTSNDTADVFVWQQALAIALDTTPAGVG
jgi:hypothetical protein